MYGRFACSSISTTQSTQSTTQSSIHSNSNSNNNDDKAASDSNGVYVSSECEGVGERKRERDTILEMDEWIDKMD